MKLNINKKVLREIIYIAGLAFVLSGCGKQNEVDYYPFSESEYSSDADLDNTSDSYDDSSDDDSSDDSENETDNSDQTKEVLVSNVSELKDYFEDDVDFSDVEDAIHNNSNLNQKDKKNLLNLVQRLEEKAPTIDLRCLYENCKLLSIEKKERQKNSKTMAIFSKKEHKITLFKDKKSSRDHEGLHMVNTLYLYQEDENIFLNKDFRFDKDGSSFFLDEGFIAWFNNYLFNENPGYSIQSSDINIIKYILNLNDDELIQTFTSENYTSITTLLSQYLTEEEIEKWMEISQEELKDSISSSQINEKYSLLLKACVASRNGVVSSDEMYQIITLLSKSYKNYSKSYKEDVSIMHKKFKETLRKYLDYTNQDISILDNNNSSIEYCDIDQMYLIEKEENKFILAEKYIDSNGSERYYGEFSSYETKDSDIVVPINNLLNYEAEYRDSYTISDLVSIYYSYKSEYVLYNDRGAYQKTP